MLFLYEIGVAEAHRRRGVAGAMVRFLKGVCREKGLFKVFVIASADTEIGPPSPYTNFFHEDELDDVT